jgi:hypothetical protein
VNDFLRNFPLQIVGKFQKELKGILSYIYLLQSSIEHQSRLKPLLSELVVYRGLPSNGANLITLYDSMVGEVIIWPSFTSTSKDSQYVIQRFLQCDDNSEDCDGILFKIHFPPGAHRRLSKKRKF